MKLYELLGSSLCSENYGLFVLYLWRVIMWLRTFEQYCVHTVCPLQHEFTQNNPKCRGFDQTLTTIYIIY